MKLLFRSGWTLMTIASVYIAGFTVIYFNFRPDTFFLSTKPGYVAHDLVWRIFFYLHISASMICLLSGPFQFLRKLRIQRPAFHRNLGKLYIGSVLAVAAPTGLYLAFFANGGFPTSLGFLLLSLAWWLCTWKGYAAIRHRKIAEHQQWMIRSFALSFSAVTLRVIWMPVLSHVLTDQQLILHLTAYLNWIPNLIIAEILIQKYRTFA